MQLLKRLLIALAVFAILLIVMLYSQSSSARLSGDIYDLHSYPSGAVYVTTPKSSPSHLMAKDDLEKLSTIAGVREIAPYLHVRSQMSGVNTNIYGFEKVEVAMEPELKLVELESITKAKKGQRTCIVSDYFAKTAGVKVGDRLEGQWIKCEVAAVAESGKIFSKNFVVTDLVGAQNELIESDPFYKFLNKRSTEAVSCGRCHTVLTKAIKEAVREAALVFDPRMPVSGGFVLVNEENDVEKVIKAARPRIPDLSVRSTDNLNKERTLGPLYDLFQ